MFNLISFMRDTGLPGLGILLATGLAAAIGVVTSGRTEHGWRFPAPIPVFAASLPLAFALVHGLLTEDLTAILAIASPEQRSRQLWDQVGVTANVRVAVIVSWLAIGVIVWRRRAVGPSRIMRVGSILAIAATVAQIALGVAFVTYGSGPIGIMTAILMAGAGLPVIAAASRPDEAVDSLITACCCWALAAGAWWGVVYELSEVFGLVSRFHEVALDSPHHHRLILVSLLEAHELGDQFGIVSVIVALVPAFGTVLVRHRTAAPSLAIGALVMAIPLLYLDFDAYAFQLRQLIPAIYGPDDADVRATGG